MATDDTVPDGRADAGPADAPVTAAGADAPPEEHAPAAPVGGDAPASTTGISRHRLVLIDALIALTTLVAIVGMLSIWANRLLFNPDNWENTSTQLLENPLIRNATANYAVSQLYANVNVAGLIKSNLPPRLQGLADPAAGALRNLAVQGVELALTRPRVQQLWAKANRAADQTFIAIVNGGKGAVKVNGGVVSLDLASLVDSVASQLGLPPNLGAKLPPSVARLTIFKSTQLKFVQDVGGAVKGLALWLTILVPLLYALAILLARGHRRRTLMTVGFAIVFAGIVGVAGRHILETQITNSLTSDEALRPTFSAVVAIGTQILGTIAGAFIFVGAIVVVCAWFAGPTRICATARRAIAPFLRDEPAATFAITAAVLLLVFIWDPIPATSTPVGIIVFSALAFLGTEVLRRQTEREFPEARKGDATAAIRARIGSSRGRTRAASFPDNGAPITDQIERLAKLRDEGAITGDEYDAAKARLLRA
jgi:Short C-terminal domain